MSVIYIPGLNSSNKSKTVQALQERFDDVIAPELPDNPAHWVSALNPIIMSAGKALETTIIGSSTGGLFAYYYASQFGFNTVLINPIMSAEQLVPFVGTNRNHYTNHSWNFTMGDIQALTPLECSLPHQIIPILLILSKSDALLDRNIALEKMSNMCELMEIDSPHRVELTPTLLNKIEELHNTICL